MQCPWGNPKVTGPSGTATFKKQAYNTYQIEWSTGKPWDHGPDGQSPEESASTSAPHSHQSNSRIPIPSLSPKVVLLDKNGTELDLHPRFLGFDSGTLAANDGVLFLRFFNTHDSHSFCATLWCSHCHAFVPSTKLIPGGRMRDWHNIPFTAWPGGIQL
jgi:hypothetical protein